VIYGQNNQAIPWLQMISEKSRRHRISELSSFQLLFAGFFSSDGPKSDNLCSVLLKLNIW